MTRTVPASALGSEFDGFLYEPICEDRNGMRLSVLSALARLGVDPWQEAAKIARLPADTATQRLTSLLSALPDKPSDHFDSRAVAARLIPLLPRQAGPGTSAHAISPGSGTMSRFQAFKHLFLVNAIFLIFMLAAQYIAANHHAPVQIDKAYAPVSSAVVPPVQPPRSDP
jgi:hypothetical protein